MRTIVAPPIVVLGLFDLATTLVTEPGSNNASVVPMILVGIDAAVRIGTEPFAFVLTVAFAASAAILSPIGYQTNLMVYGPSGYRFTDSSGSVPHYRWCSRWSRRSASPPSEVCERATSGYLSTFWPTKFTG